MHVYLLPADARFEGQLAARVVQGQAAARKDGRGEGRLQKVVRSLIEQWERSAVSRGKTGAGRHGGGSEIGGVVGAIRAHFVLGRRDGQYRRKTPPLPGRKPPTFHPKLGETPQGPRTQTHRGAGADIRGVGRRPSPTCPLPAHR